MRPLCEVPQFSDTQACRDSGPRLANEPKRKITNKRKHNEEIEITKNHAKGKEDKT